MTEAFAFQTRVATPEDGPSLEALETACFGDDAWGEGQVAASTSQKNVFALIVRDSRAEIDVAFAVWRLTVNEAELLTLGVSPPYRRRGHATHLLDQVATDCQQKGAHRLILEVATENVNAFALYLSSGFTEIGRRPRYYKNGADAIVMAKTL